ncbi:MAG: HAD family hydrolase [Candidatus Nanoarchaeia archaeon]
MKLGAIIFDMDGVLVDSTKYNWESFRLIWKKLGVDLSDHNRSKYLGRSIKDQIQLVKEEYAYSKEIDFQKFVKDALEIQLDIMKHELVQNKKVLELIKSARQKNIKIAVATASTGVRAKKMLELLGVIDELDLLVTAEDVAEHKPSPDVYLKTAEVLDVKAEECVVFEDAINGIVAAKKAGMKVIGFKNKYVTEKEMTDFGAEYAINDFSEVTITSLENL